MLPTTAPPTPDRALAAADLISSPDAAEPAFVVSTAFRIAEDHGPVTTATLVATAHGLYEARIDGAPIDDRLFTPGWTSYPWRLQCQTYFLATDLIATWVRGSRHLLQFEVGNGWWRGDMGFEGAHANYGTDIGVVAALTLQYEDGHQQCVTTSEMWEVTRSRTTTNTLYEGQHLDLRRSPGPPRPARVITLDRSTLVPQVDAGVHRQETLAPQRIWLSPSGRILVDFGQNLTGWIRIRVPADPGRVILVRHAETLEHGELATRPLRSARATDLVIAGEKAETIEPTFTYHGFRFAEIMGWPGMPTSDDLTAVVVHSSVTPTGWFRCSDERVNQLWRNAVWGLRGNLLDIPTDCPQRDERLGWTGDLAVFAPAATHLFDLRDFLHKWLLDLAVELRHRGTVPAVVPDLYPYMTGEARGKVVGATCIWGDAAAWVPYTLWQQYGDLDRLREHFPAMVRHLDTVQAALSPNGLWDTGFQWADWLDPDAPPQEPGAAKADPSVVATACAFRSARWTAEAAEALGEHGVATRLEALASRIREAFRRHYVTQDGRVRSDCATVYALAICFGLLDPDERAAAGGHLARCVRTTGHRISTGFAGTPFVTWALCDTDHVDDAYALLLQTECPSWLYPVTMGATTVWERWDAVLPDGSLHPGTMTSLNHYALGAVIDWLHRGVGGIRAASPGYAAIEYRPTPGPGLSWAETVLDTPHGRARCHWRRDRTELVVQVDHPNVPGVLVLPDGTRREVAPGEQEFRIVE